MAISIADIVVSKGVAYSASMTLTDDNGNPLNISGYTFLSEIYDENAQKMGALNVNVTNAAEGIIKVEVDAAVTQLLSPGVRYYWDLLSNDGVNGWDVMIQGRVEVQEVITNIPAV